MTDDDADIGGELALALSKTRQVLQTREMDLAGLEEHLAKLADSAEPAAKSAVRRLNKRKESHAKEAQLLRDAVEAVERAMEADDVREENFSALMSEKDFEVARAGDHAASKLEDEKQKLARKLEVARQDVEMFKVQTRDAARAKDAAESEAKSLAATVARLERELKAAAPAKDLKLVKGEAEKLEKRLATLERELGAAKEKAAAEGAELADAKKALAASKKNVQQALKLLQEL